MPDAVIVLPSFFNDVCRSIVAFQSECLSFKLLNHLCLDVEQYDPGLYLIKLNSPGLSYN